MFFLFCHAKNVFPYIGQIQRKNWYLRDREDMTEINTKNAHKKGFQNVSVTCSYEVDGWSTSGCCSKLLIILFLSKERESNAIYLNRIYNTTMTLTQNG